MNPSYKWKYEEMRSNQPADKGESVPEREGSTYEEAGHIRFLCFVWLDGRRIFLNYNYLISAEYAPEENSIKLAFTTHSVLLKGIHLETLFYDLMQQKARQIICRDVRYNAIESEKNPVVNTIDIVEITSG